MEYGDFSYVGRGRGVSSRRFVGGLGRASSGENECAGKRARVDQYFDGVRAWADEVSNAIQLAHHVAMGEPRDQRKNQLTGLMASLASLADRDHRGLHNRPEIYRPFVGTCQPTKRTQPPRWFTSGKSLPSYLPSRCFALALLEFIATGRDAVVRKLQRDHGLVPDGIARPATWKIMDTTPLCQRRHIKHACAHRPLRPKAGPNGIRDPVGRNAAPRMLLLGVHTDLRTTGAIPCRESRGRGRQNGNGNEAGHFHLASSRSTAAARSPSAGCPVLGACGSGHTARPDRYASRTRFRYGSGGAA